VNHDAHPLPIRALTIDENGCGPESPEVAIDLNNLAETLRTSGRRDEAEPLLRRALAIDEKTYGSDHPNITIRPAISAVRSCIVEAAYPFALGSSFSEPDETQQCASPGSNLDPLAIVGGG
jgi:hypothetical protein